MNQLLLLILGIFLSVIGIVNISGNISTIHAYNRRNVKEEDVPSTEKPLAQGRSLLAFPLRSPISSRFGTNQSQTPSFFRQSRSAWHLFFMGRSNIITASFNQLRKAHRRTTRPPVRFFTPAAGRGGLSSPADSAR